MEKKLVGKITSCEEYNEKIKEFDVLFNNDACHVNTNYAESLYDRIMEYENILKKETLEGGISQ